MPFRDRFMVPPPPPPLPARGRFDASRKGGPAGRRTRRPSVLLAPCGNNALPNGSHTLGKAIPWANLPQRGDAPIEIEGERESDHRTTQHESVSVDRVSSLGTPGERERQLAVPGGAQGIDVRGRDPAASTGFVKRRDVRAFVRRGARAQEASRGLSSEASRSDPHNSNLYRVRGVQDWQAFFPEWAEPGGVPSLFVEGGPGLPRVARRDWAPTLGCGLRDKQCSSLEFRCSPSRTSPPRRRSDL